MKALFWTRQHPARSSPLCANFRPPRFGLYDNEDEREPLVVLAGLVDRKNQGKYEDANGRIEGLYKTHRDRLSLALIKS